MRLVHLSDPHLSALSAHSFWGLNGKRRLGYLSWQRRRRWIHQRTVLDQLRAAVATETPDRLLVSGDLTQLGLPDEIEAAASWLASLREIAPVSVVPGNHDLYQADSLATVVSAWAPYLELSALDAYPVVSTCGRVVVIGVCSARPEPFWSAGGEVGSAQLARLEQVLRRHAGKSYWVMLHHPPLPGICRRRKALRDAAALSALLEAHAVDVVLHGHVHRNLDYRLGADARVFATASASSSAPGAPASYRVFDIAENGETVAVHMQLKSLDHDGAPFATIDTASWRCGGADAGNSAGGLASAAR